VTTKGKGRWHKNPRVCERIAKEAFMSNNVPLKPGESLRLDGGLMLSNMTSAPVIIRIQYSWAGGGAGG
jgi:hypothetical protein